MHLLFAIGAVQAIFLSGILTIKRPKQHRDWFLIAWMIFLGMHLTGVYGAFSGFYRHYPVWFGIDTAFLLLQGPFLWIYVCLATGHIQKLSPTMLLHALPYIGFTGYFLFFVHAYQGSGLYEYIVSTLTDDANFVVFIFGFLNHFHFIIYLLMSVRVFRIYQAKIGDALSYTEGVNMKWLETMLIGFSLVALFIIAGLLLNDLFELISHDFKANMVYAAFALLPFYFSFMSIQQKVVYSSEEVAFQKKYEASSLEPNMSEIYASQLTVLMESEKLFLNGKLTVNDLALRLDIPPKHLSQVINENFKQNFFAYINSYRVEEAKRRICNNDYAHLKLLSIGLDCGFNTKSSFNSIFKKFTGKTPSEFKESNTSTP